MTQAALSKLLSQPSIDQLSETPAGSQVFSTESSVAAVFCPSDYLFTRTRHPLSDFDPSRCLNTDREALSLLMILQTS